MLVDQREFHLRDHAAQQMNDSVAHKVVSDVVLEGGDKSYARHKMKTNQVQGFSVDERFIIPANPR